MMVRRMYRQNCWNNSVDAKFLILISSPATESFLIDSIIPAEKVYCLGLFFSRLFSGLPKYFLRPFFVNSGRNDPNGKSFLLWVSFCHVSLVFLSWLHPKRWEVKWKIYFRNQDDIVKYIWWIKFWLYFLSFFLVVWKVTHVRLNTVIHLDPKSPVSFGLQEKNK